MNPIEQIALKLNDMIVAGKLSREDSLFFANALSACGGLKKETADYLKNSPFMVSEIIDIKAENIP